ncbi:MAG: PEP-CTERM sorting domain-containing protein [Opitutales bacterium]|nr:PEP-CTERM sorting domain-containing protein [Opitutales bacterium]
MKLNFKPITFALAFIGLTSVSLHAQQTILVDFGDADTDPASTAWNAGVRADTGVADLTDTTGNSTGIGLSFTNGDDFGSDDRWDADNHVNPPWVDPSTTDGARILSDRLSWDRNTEGTMVLSGLKQGFTYDIEIASGLAQGGSTGSTGLGRDPNEFEMMGGNGLVEGFNPHLNFNLGTTVTWYPNPAGTNDDNISQGWILWEGVTPDAQGEITLTIRGLSGSNSRGTLNAMQITAIPEPSTYAAIFALGALGMILLRRKLRK